MFSSRALSARRAPASLCARSLRLNHPSRTLSLLSRKRAHTAHTSPSSHSSPTFPRLPNSRTYATKSAADSLIEEIQDQYATARDEFEIATEETEKKTVYAADDRAAAREELDKLKGMFENALKGPDGEEVKNRIGQRIRELENALVALEESALED